MSGIKCPVQKHEVFGFDASVKTCVCHAYWPETLFKCGKILRKVRSCTFLMNGKCAAKFLKFGWILCVGRLFKRYMLVYLFKETGGTLGSNREK